MTHHTTPRTRRTVLRDLHKEDMAVHLPSKAVTVVLLPNKVVTANSKADTVVLLPSKVDTVNNKAAMVNSRAGITDHLLHRSKAVMGSLSKVVIQDNREATAHLLHHPGIRLVM